METVRAKKHLGQHFLRDDNIARKIVGSLTGHRNYPCLLEVGPGMGVLTKYLADLESPLTRFVEIDPESAEYLREKYPAISPRLIEQDFLTLDLREIPGGKTGIIGNFPYNISSQILFRVYEFEDRVEEVVGMFQKEVAQRIASPPGSKDYGILSVLIPAFYQTEYLFTVSEHVFQPPPKVKSAVVRLRRNDRIIESVLKERFTMVVKTAFNQRRKTLRNSLRIFSPADIPEKYANLRAEQLGIDDFLELTGLINNNPNTLLGS